MDKDDMQGMMRDMMERTIAKMSPDEKMDMMMGMMGKLKEGIDMKEMMSKMGAKGDQGGMKEMMAKMMQGGEGQESMMPEMMLKSMMPHCIEMMMPSVSKEKRADLASGMIATLVEQATSGMTDEEKASFVEKVVQSVKA